MEYNQRNMFSSFPEGINQNMEIATPTYDQVTIKPPDKNKTHGKKSTRLIVDSRERITDLHPDPSKYTLELEHEERDVVSVELSQANIPNSFYNIYHFTQGGKLYANNIIHLHLVTSDAGNISSTLELDVGKYIDLTTFETHLKTLLTNLNTQTSTYIELSDVKIDTLTSKIDITFVPKSNFDKVVEFYFEFVNPNTCNNLNPFNKAEKKYPSHSLGPMMGFNKRNAGKYQGTVVGDASSSNLIGIGTTFLEDFKNCNKFPTLIIQNTNSTWTTPLEIEQVISDRHIILKSPPPSDFTSSAFYPTSIISPNVIELDCDKYIILDIRELHRLKSNTDTIEDRFAIIPIDYLNCSTKLNIGTIPTQREIKYFNPPFARLSKMNIAFYRYNGDPLHFNGVNHILDFNVTALNQSAKYNDINSGTINN